VQAAGGGSCVVLPNDADIAAAARQAAGLVSTEVYVAPTRSFPQVVAAFLAIMPERDLGENESAIDEALRRVTTIEVTTAVRDARIDGIDVRNGMAIAFVDGKLKAAAGCLDRCVTEGMKQADRADASLVTVYWGNGRTEDEAYRIGALAQHACTNAELEIAFGGQPHYDYIIALE
jgi:dihydroxyacetone kinase-like predicted kinase